MKRQDTLENQANYVYLSLGSNLGNRKRNLTNAGYLLRSSGINILKYSNYYKTKSWPNNKFPYYLNSVIFAKTKLRLIDLFLKIKDIEKKLGRKNVQKNYPRTCDIDIIDFNGLNIKKKYKNLKIQVPHSRMEKRNFVLFPLYDINKNWIHPKNKKKIVNLLIKLSLTDLGGIKIL